MNRALTLSFLLAALCGLPAFSQDLIVEGKACIGIDCADGELFGLDIQKLKHTTPGCCSRTPAPPPVLPRPTGG